MFNPQQYACPPSLRAQVCVRPTSMAVKRTAVLTAVGVPTGSGDVPPVPFWPQKFFPQQYATPSGVPAQVLPAPREMLLKGSPPPPGMGVGLPGALWGQSPGPATPSAELYCPQHHAV